MRTTAPGKRPDGAPDRAVGRARHHGVEAGRRSACPWSDPPADLARRTRRACRCRWCRGSTASSPATFAASPVSSNIFMSSQPTTVPAAAGPQHVVGVVAELQMMRPEAGVDERVLHGLGIEHRKMAVRCAPPETALAEGWSEPFLQKAGLFGPRTAAANHTRPFAIEHAVMVVRLARPDLFVAPVRRRLHRLVLAHRRPAYPAWIAHGRRKFVAVFVFGSRTGMTSMLSSVEPYSGP